MKNKVIIFLLFCILIMAFTSIYLIKQQSENINVIDEVIVVKTKDYSEVSKKTKSNKEEHYNSAVENPVIINPVKSKKKGDVKKYLKHRIVVNPKDLENETYDEMPVENPVVVKNGQDMNDETEPVENPEIEY